MRISALVVDDEPLAREGLRAVLEGDRDVACVREAANGREAVESIRAERPDVVFLDVQMPELDGMGVLHAVGLDAMPEIVFVTAHDRFAIQAFELNAIDYLLKPVTEVRCREALERTKARLSGSRAVPESAAIASLLTTMRGPRRSVDRIAVRAAGKTTFVNVQEIAWIEAAENYVRLHVGRAAHLLHATMSGVEDALGTERFVRIHRSLLVNIGQIRQLQTSERGDVFVTLDGGTRLKAGRTYHDTLRALSANPFDKSPRKLL